ncbi:MAG: phosphoribosyltransferase [Chloroflexi bacterium]|nr:phosphoribosyltransferase [Chloroflexota bacterium]
MKEQFHDRHDAGRFLADQLMEYADRDDVLVLALPRGGVPVAFEVAQALNVPLDVFVVRKLGVPGHEELAMGAIASGGTRVLNRDVVLGAGIGTETLDQIAAREREELRRREQAYRDNRPEPEIDGQTVILVDDGLATGATMWAAVVALRQLDPAQIIVAVPTASPETCAAFEQEVDRVICFITPEAFGGVGRWYRDFAQTTDEQVRDLLCQATQS